MFGFCLLLFEYWCRKTGRLEQRNGPHSSDCSSSYFLDLDNRVKNNEMSDESMGGEGGDAPQMEDKKFFVDRAKSGRATCRKCKQKLEAGGLRIAKAGHNPFGPGLMKLWHHVPCMFEVFAKQRASTARINTPDDVAGWSDLDEDDRNHILSFLPEGAAAAAASSASSQKGKAAPAPAAAPSAPASSAGSKPSAEDRAHKDNSFREFRRLCAEVANLPAYGDKTAAVRKMFTSGTSGESFKGDLLLWVRLLLPGAVKRVYNIQSKQIVKLFSRILHADQDEMLEDLEQGDVAETVRIFFERSTHLQPTKKSTLSLYDVDEFLEKLSTMTKEDEQAHHFKQIAKRCTSNDLKMIIRLVKHDLRINAGPKHILDAVHADAYQAFQMSRDISSVIARATGKNFLQGKGESGKKQGTAPGGMSIGVALMTPVLPMLAEACKSVEQAMKKCPNGMFSEIKYDGERVQVHKRGDDFKYFSRSLKPVMPHKVSHFKDYIPEAFPHGKDVILDSEILMIDTQTGKPLPFGTLGRQKKEGLKSANVCLFVFDCIYYNGEILLSKPIKERRKILHSVMTEIPNRIMFSEAEEVHQPKQLEVMIEKVFKLGLEGLVLKDLMSTYEPGKRHWLKVKKDYLFGGAMADAADLVVLGAWFGTGQKGGMMSVFLMGCYDTYRDKWCTVTKVHTGHDDKTLERLQDELGPQVTKISKEASRVPSWLNCTKTMIPDFVAKDPKSMPVWEITGAEFTRHDVHTADGISIRFPRVTRIRSDKDWKTATSLVELKELYKKSKDNADFSLIQSSPKSSPDVSKRQRLTRSRSPTPVKDTRKESKKTNNKQEEIVDQEMKEEVSEENNSARKRSLSPNKRGENSGSGYKRKFGSNQSSPSEEEPQDSSTPKKPLPDVFAGVRLVLPPATTDEEALLRRYFVGYGGTVVTSVDDSTHVLHPKGTAKRPTGRSDAKHVRKSWLWHSIRFQRLQPISPYKVVWVK
ncbi:DNA ligase 3 isoform X3 [Schistocerca gregaria]|uniref:DNA ligase 3 isoform X3 n=1 Tax=Schistocerca gregaria TaxID=7010 RepID=UPI00211E2F67|nr:DNA ligase 3 isoform X3 [Schistocerca gregaria]